MRTHILKRAGQAVLVLWAAYTLSFLLLNALPGDAVNNRIQNPEAQLSPESAQALIAYYGLDRPLAVQYFSGLGSVLRGDLGFSLTNGLSVGSLLADALPSTLKLTGLALLLALIFAALLATGANYLQWTWLRGLLSSVPALFGSIPTFVVGILALQFFSFELRLIPSTDDGTFAALLAPAVTLAIFITAPLAQVLTTSIARTREQPFVHVLRARGASESYSFGRGVLRNSSLPVLTLLGLVCGELIAGSVVTEAVFARSGIGQVTVNAVGTQDLPVLQGVVLVAALAYVVVNFAVDIAYPFLDPRILVATGPKKRVEGVLGSRAKALLGASQPAGITAVSIGHGRGLPAEVSMP